MSQWKRDAVIRILLLVASIVSTNEKLNEELRTLRNHLTCHVGEERN